MELGRLPEELLIIIIKKLDLKSIYRLYEAGNDHIRNVISSQGVIKKCDLSLSTMATGKFLKNDFFKSISGSLQELNLRGIPDLTKTLLVPAMKKLKCLATLDISYTNIGIFELLDTYAQCPTIKNIAIDYQFYQKHSTKKSFSPELLESCQNVFANFENVHFVGSVDNLLLSNLPRAIIEKAKLQTLRYSLAKVDKMFTYHKYVESKPINCNHFVIHFYVSKLDLQNTRAMPLFLFEREVNMKILKELSFDIEFIYIEENVCCSPLFVNFFKENFYIGVQQDIQSATFGFKNSVLMIWNKETTTFDEEFYSKLKNNIRESFPKLITYGEIAEQHELLNDWVCVRHDSVDPELFEPVLKVSRLSNRGRNVVPQVILNYDQYTDEMKQLELTLCFLSSFGYAVNFSPQSAFLEKLTFVCLLGTAQFADGFFGTLFRNCKNLYTLDVNTLAVSHSAFAVVRTVPLSQSLRNFRLCDRALDFNTLFSSLAQCKTLENIQLHDTSQVMNDIPIPDALFRQCENLYCFIIQANMSEQAKNKKLQILNKSKQKFGKNYLHLELLVTGLDLNYDYHPCMDVFKVHTVTVLHPDKL